MTPQRRPRREQHFWTTYLFEGALHHHRVTIYPDELTASHPLEVALRESAARHQTLIAARFSDVELVSYQEI